MFETLPPLAPDPILGLAEIVRADERPGTIDLTAGVYKDDSGTTPVFESVRLAQSAHLAEERAKDYLPIGGTAEFSALVGGLVLGEHDTARVRTLQTPGGTGALSIAAGLLARLDPTPVVWLPDPTWPNHHGIVALRHLQIRSYDYPSLPGGGLDVDAVLAGIAAVGRGDVVLLHGCCHNPTGVDPHPDDWARIIAAVAERGAVPLVDLAYLGLGDGVEPDRVAVDAVLAAGIDAVVCSSFSKNMGLYRERVGGLSVIGAGPDAASLAFDQAKSVVRATYSNPPSFGGQVVTRVLADPELRATWTGELDALRDRINTLRVELAAAATEAGLPYLRTVAEERGMFAMTGLPPEIVSSLRQECGIYVLDNGRANVAGLSLATIPTFIEAIARFA